MAFRAALFISFSFVFSLNLFFPAQIQGASESSHQKIRTDDCLSLVAMLSQMQDRSLDPNYPELFPPQLSKQLVLFEARYGITATRQLLEFLRQALNREGVSIPEDEQTELGMLWIKAAHLFISSGKLDLSGIRAKCKTLFPTPSTEESFSSRFRSLSVAVKKLREQSAPTFHGTYIPGLLNSTTLAHAAHRITQINAANQKSGLPILSPEQEFKVRGAFLEGLGFKSFDWDPRPDIDIELARLVVLDHHGRHDQGQMINTTRKLIRDLEEGLMTKGPSYIFNLNERYRNYTTDNAFDSFTAVDPIIYSRERADNFYASHLLRVALNPTQEKLGFPLDREDVKIVLGENSMTYAILTHFEDFQLIANEIKGDLADAEAASLAIRFDSQLARKGHNYAVSLHMSFAHLFQQRISDLEFDYKATA